MLTNIILYLDVIKPRLFSENADELNRPLPLNDVCFEFIFDREASEERSDLNKLTIKDMREQIQDLENVKVKLEYLFKALAFTFGDQMTAQQLASQQILSMRVEVNLKELFMTVESILSKKVRIEGEEYLTQQVCGLQTREYAKAILISKFKCLDLLPSLFSELGNENCLKFVSTLPDLMKSVITDVQRDSSSFHSLDRVISLYNFSIQVMIQYGLKAKDTVAVSFFADSDFFNICSILVATMKNIVISRDKTVIDLGVPLANPLAKFKTGKVLQKVT